MTRRDSPADAEADDGRDGIVYVVGIGPGLPDHATHRAREIIEDADCVVVADLYRRFLCEVGVLPAAGFDAFDDGHVGDSTGGTDGHRKGSDDETVLIRENGNEQTLLRSSMGRQRELAEESFQRARNGEDVVHVSGGDPNVYGKADLLFAAADRADAADVPIEVVPGVTAAAGAAAAVGAPLSNDFCTVSLSEKWRRWDEIEGKLRAAAESGFVIVLYNPRGNHRRALSTLREVRSDDVPIAFVTDVGRGTAGRVGERRRLTTLEDALAEGSENGSSDTVDAMATTILVGTEDTEIREIGGRHRLFTPRGNRDITEF